LDLEGGDENNGRENEYSSFSGNDLYEEFARGRDRGRQRPGGPSNPGYFNDDPFFDDYFGPSPGRPNRHAFTAPPRVSETTQVRYDPRFQSEVLRVLRREEYTDARTGQIYFRVIGQEFLEEHDYIYGHLGYRPLTEPYLVEEGYASTAKGENTKQYETNFDQMSGRQTPSKIEPGEIITPDTEELLTSPDRRYYAGLTPDCELIVVRDEGPDKEDTIIWSSDTFLPPSYLSTAGCFLSMYGPQLVLFVGEDVDRITAVLWSSPPPPIVPDRDHTGDEGEQEYYASLDNDGSLAVYRRRIEGNYSKSSDFESNKFNRGTERDAKKFSAESKSLSMWRKFLMKLGINDITVSPQTKAAAAWMSVRRWAVQILTRQPSSFSARGRSSVHDNVHHQHHSHRDECVYATGPAGCLTPGRYTFRLLDRVKRSIDKFVDFLLDETEDGDDLIDTLWRTMSMKRGKP